MTAWTGPAVAGPRYDAALQLLDRQLVDVDGLPVGKVDDLELRAAPQGVLEVVALLVGPGALGPRLGGRLGRWTVAGWRRLRADAGAEPLRVPIGDVADIGSAIRLARADRGESGDLERWLREHVVRRIPGSGADPAGAPGPPPPGPDVPSHPAGPPSGARRLNDLLGLPVRDARGARLGSVNDVRLAPAPGVAGVRAPLRVEALVVDGRHPGSLLGYDRRAEQGPWPVRAGVRWLHRGACLARWEGATIDWARGEVRVTDCRPLLPGTGDRPR